jgi:hypothetical protein
MRISHIHVISSDVESELKADDYPVILWGSHHKTGTYLARKIFAVICARAHWCCVFHVTRYVDFFKMIYSF